MATPTRTYRPESTIDVRFPQVRQTTSEGDKQLQERRKPILAVVMDLLMDNSMTIDAVLLGGPLGLVIWPRRRPRHVVTRSYFRSLLDGKARHQPVRTAAGHLRANQQLAEQSAPALLQIDVLHLQIATETTA